MWIWKEMKVKDGKNGAEEGFCGFSPRNASHTHAHTETYTQRHE